MIDPRQSPYQEALEWIGTHAGTGDALGLAKLVLSLWNSDCGYSYRECVTGLDSPREALALRVVTHFHRVGEDHDLRAVGEAVCAAYPVLWDVAMAGDAAKVSERERLRGMADH